MEMDNKYRIPEMTNEDREMEAKMEKRGEKITKATKQCVNVHGCTDPKLMNQYAQFMADGGNFEK